MWVMPYDFNNSANIIAPVCFFIFAVPFISLGLSPRILCVMKFSYFIASGFVGEPTAPVIGKAGATNINS